MFGRIFLSNYRLSEAAMVVQSLLEEHGRGSALGRNAGTIANKLVGRAYDNDPALFDGKRGLRPHKLSLAAVALAQGVKVMKDDTEGRLCFNLALGTVLLEVSGKPHDFALSSNDWFLLDLAQEVYLTSATSFRPNQMENDLDEPGKAEPLVAMPLHQKLPLDRAKASDDKDLERRSVSLNDRIAAMRSARR
jgi:hypothetical protein